MPKRFDKDEEWAINLLQQIIERSREKRDALSGHAVKLIKKAQTIMKKRRKMGTKE